MTTETYAITIHRNSDVPFPGLTAQECAKRLQSMLPESFEVTGADTLEFTEPEFQVITATMLLSIAALTHDKEMLWRMMTNLRAACRDSGINLETLTDRIITAHGS